MSPGEGGDRPESRPRPSRDHARGETLHRERPSHPDIRTYDAAQPAEDRAGCQRLATGIDQGLPEAESRIWHGHPVWFLEGNPVAGYSTLEDCVRLLFWSGWSGQSFDEPGLTAQGSFEAVEARYTSEEQVDEETLARWLETARDIQWDHENIVKRTGKRIRRTGF